VKLHEKKIREVFYDTGYDKQEFMDDLKQWAIAVVKKLRCERLLPPETPTYSIQYSCGERPSVVLEDQNNWCFSCRLRVFLIDRFEITEEELK